MADEDTVSTSPATDNAPVAAPETSTPSPQPSTETSSDTGSSKESLLDAVLKVVPATTEADVLAPKDEEAPPEATEPESQQAEEEAETAADDDDDVSPDTSPKIRRKINKLLKQRRELRLELDSLRPTAQIGSEVQNFAQENRLTGDDVAKLLQLGAMLRNGDHAGFYKAVGPYVRTSQEVLGIVLPQDLAAMVKQGQMTETAAKSYAAQRINGQRAEYELQNVTQENQRQQVRYVQNDVKRAVSSFELRLSASDPDYKVKQPIIQHIAKSMLADRGNRIDSVEEALAISQAAYDEATKQTRAFRSPPRATHPMPNGASQSPSARAAPKTLMEAAMLGLENSRRGG